MKYGILTTFCDLSPQYSLTSIVADQARMIHNAGHTPVLFVLTNFNVEAERAKLPPSTEIRAVVPVFYAIDYETSADLTEEHAAYAAQAQAALRPYLSDLEAMIAHDILFLGWNLPLNRAVHNLSVDFPELIWLHWVHSVPAGAFKDFWQLPEGHSLVYLNQTDQLRCAEHFRVWPDRVYVIPTPRDPRGFLMTTTYAKDLVTRKRILEADFVQTLPVATDRIHDKGITQIFDVFANLKRQGSSVRLIVCNAWCTTDEAREKVAGLLNSARDLGLDPELEVIFTSVDAPAKGLGVSAAVVRDLMLVSNLFVFPTKSEVFSLVVSEVALTGQLMVLNSSLPCQAEIAGSANAMYFPFGSLQIPAPQIDATTWYADVARLIRHRFSLDPSIRAKTHFRQSYSYEKVWDRITQVIATERFRRQGGIRHASTSPTTGTTVATPGICLSNVVITPGSTTKLCGGGAGSIFGAALAEEATRASPPLPTTLGGVTVRLNGTEVPLIYVSPEQIDFQVPWELLSASTAALTVTTASGTSPAVTVELCSAAPAIFTVDANASDGQGAIQFAGTAIFAAPPGAIAGAISRPAASGDRLTIYCSGLGAVTNTPATGSAADGVCAVHAPVSVTLGGEAAQVLFAGLAPGRVGLYQVNVQVPAGVASGNAVPVIVTTAGLDSNVATIAIQ